MSIGLISSFLCLYTSVIQHALTYRSFFFSGTAGKDEKSTTKFTTNRNFYCILFLYYCIALHGSLPQLNSKYLWHLHYLILEFPTLNTNLCDDMSHNFFLRLLVIQIIEKRLTSINLIDLSRNFAISIK